MIKLIASDLDGTLLDNNGNIPKEFGNIIEVLNLKNIKFAIASGRNYREAVHRFEKYKNDIIFICDNGSSVYYRDECIYCNTLDKDTIDNLISIGRNISNSYVTLSGDKGFYIEDESIANQIRDICLNKDSVIDVDNLNNVKDLIFKVNIYDLVNTETNSYKEFAKFNLPGIIVRPSGVNWLDIYSSNVNKGTAIDIIQKKFNISKKETMVFGDYLNDLEMMENAYYSYAMKNGHEKIKEVSNFETDFTNNENGVIETIKKYDKYFQQNESLLLMHRNLAKNVDNATAWYWFFNEWKGEEIDKETFVSSFHPYLSINGMSVKQKAVEKEFNCLKSTYLTEKSFDLQTIMDEDTYPFLGPLHLLQKDGKKIKKRHLSKKDISSELLIYAIAKDNVEDGFIVEKQISIDKLAEDKGQVCRYFSLNYSKLIEILLEAENKGYIRLYNNFGNRFVEFSNVDSKKLIERLYESR